MVQIIRTLKENGRCGIRCRICPYFGTLCVGCTLHNCVITECLKGASYTGITYPRSGCILRDYCPKGGKNRPPPIPIPETRRKSLTKIGFPHFIPEISIIDEMSWFWKEGIELPAVFVLLWQLLLNESTLSKVSSKGLHDYLGYEGKIFLSTVMQDELINRLRRHNYFELVKNLRPDATMIPDNYTYIDVPLYQSWSQTLQLVTYAKDFLDLDIPVVGLVKGANPDQIYWSLQKQIEMGYVSFAMPSREMFEQGLLNDFVDYALMILESNREMNAVDTELLVYGVNRRLRHRDVRYSNLSWFIEAKRWHYFKNARLYDMSDPAIRFEECGCRACNGKMPQEIIDLGFEDRQSSVIGLAKHNLLELRTSLGRE